MSENHASPQDTPQPEHPDNKPTLDNVLTEAMRFFVHRNELERKEIVWGNIKRGAMIVFFLMLMLVQIGFLVRALTGGGMPSNTTVAVIAINGAIADNSAASADKIVPLIEKACDSSAVTDIVLAIDSPGGAPYESERIVRSIETCRLTKKKRFTALIGTVGASAAYMIAIHADQVIAGNYSIVGSIGAIMRYVDAHGAVERFGISERVYRSGELKGGPSMLSGSNPELDAVNQEMVTVLGRDFLAEVVHQRGGKITLTPEELFTGRIWTGPQALEIGLVDRIGTLEDLKAGEFKDREINVLKPKSPFAEGFGMRALLSGAFRDALAAGEEPRLQ